MNIKTTLYLFGGLLLLCGIFAAFQLWDVKTPEEREQSERYLLASLQDKLKPVTPADFSRVVVERAAKGTQKAERLEFEKQGKDWKMVAPKSVRTDTSAVTRLIDQLINAEKLKYLTLKGNLSEYGLDQPAVTVTLTRDDKDTVVKLGEQGPEKDPVVYALTSESKNPTGVRKSAVDKLFAGVTDFRDKKLFDSSFDVLGIRLAPAGQKAMEFEKVERDWRFKEPKLGEADSKGVDDLALNLGGISVEKNTDFIADGPLDAAALAKYGLTKDAASAITIRRKSLDDPKKTVEQTLLIGAKDPEVVNEATRRRAAMLVTELVATSPVAAAAALQAREKQDADIGGYFAKLADDASVVRIDAKHIKLFEKKADDLRSKQLAKIDAQKADAIHLVSGGETLRFARPRLKLEGGTAGAPAEWDLHSDTRAKVKTHLDGVPRLIDVINKIELPAGKNFLDDPARLREWFGMDTIDLGLDKPQAEVHVWQDGLKRDKDGKPEGDGEPKLKDDVKAKPNFKLAIGRKDEKRGVVYVRRQVDGGDEAVLAVPDPFISGTTPPPPPRPNMPPMPEMRETVSLTDKVTGGYMAFRDHVLPSFTHANASKLTYQRGGVAYEAVKDEKKDDKGATVSNWLLKKPVEGKSQGIDLFLGQLSFLSADKLITDRATERDLKEVFGLADQPLLKAVVSVTDKDDKKKSGEFTYVIGKKTPAEGKNANHFYARIEVKPAEGAAPDANQFVFLLPPQAVQFFDTELRDATVFEEEKSAKPIEVSLTWNKPDKDKKLVETKLVLVNAPEKEGSDKKVWSVQSLTVAGKDAKAELPKLDVEKIEQLLGTAAVGKFGMPRLSPLSTKHFVVHNGKPDPKHRLDPAVKTAPPSLVVEIKYDSKLTRTLTLGDRWEPKDTEHPGLHPRAFYYASAMPTLPNAVIALEELSLKPLVDGFEFFKASEKVAGR